MNESLREENPVVPNRPQVRKLAFPFPVVTGFFSAMRMQLLLAGDAVHM